MCLARCRGVRDCTVSMNISCGYSTVNVFVNVTYMYMYLLFICCSLSMYMYNICKLCKGCQLMNNVFSASTRECYTTYSLIAVLAGEAVHVAKRGCLERSVTHILLLALPYPFMVPLSLIHISLSSHTHFPN